MRSHLHGGLGRHWVPLLPRRAAQPYGTTSALCALEESVSTHSTQAFTHTRCSQAASVVTILTSQCRWEDAQIAEDTGFELCGVPV